MVASGGGTLRRVAQIPARFICSTGQNRTRDEAQPILKCYAITIGHGKHK